MKSLLFILSIFLVGCLGPEEFSYTIEPSAEPFRDFIVAGMNSWSSEIGVRAEEISDGKISFIAEPISNAGFAHRKVIARIDPFNLNGGYFPFVRVLDWVLITINTNLLNMINHNPAYVRHVALHEIGHALDLDHVQDCDSLMRANPNACAGILALSWIDGMSAARARENVEEGWLDR